MFVVNLINILTDKNYYHHYFSAFVFYYRTLIYVFICKTHLEFICRLSYDHTHVHLFAISTVSISSNLVVIFTFLFVHSVGNH